MVNLDNWQSLKVSNARTCLVNWDSGAEWR